VLSQPGQHHVDFLFRNFEAQEFLGDGYGFATDGTVIGLAAGKEYQRKEKRGDMNCAHWFTLSYIKAPRAVTFLILFIARMGKRRQYSFALAEASAPRFSGFF